MNKKELHQVTITIEGTREMLEKFLQAYDKASDYYDCQLYAEDKNSWNAEQKFLKANKIDDITILHNYRTDFYWQIHNYFTRLDRELLVKLENQPESIERNSEIVEVKERLSRVL